MPQNLLMSSLIRALAGLTLLVLTATLQGQSVPVRSSPPPLAADESDYIRFVRSPSPDAATTPDRLQTAIVRFHRGAHRVDLVSVVHLGDAAYFEELNRRLANYDRVLYEMVGGPMPTNPRPEEELSGDMRAVRQLQNLAKSMLGLEFQLDSIDYRAAHFVHADLVWEDVPPLLQGGKDSLFAILQRAAGEIENGAAAGSAWDGAAMEVTMQRILGAMFHGTRSDLKRLIAPLLSEAESLMPLLEGEGGSLLIADRNQIVLDKLRALQQDGGARQFAIFYGAGHMPDFEAKLKALGYARGDELWLDAWIIPVGEDAADKAPAMAGLLQQMVANPELATILQELSTLMQKGPASSSDKAP